LVVASESASERSPVAPDLAVRALPQSDLFSQFRHGKAPAGFGTEHIGIRGSGGGLGFGVGRFESQAEFETDP